VTAPEATEEASGEERSETERAEQMMQDLGERIADWASRAAARAREEAEDIWAEAQALRRGDEH
jgi:hypothetical protein